MEAKIQGIQASIERVRCLQEKKQGIIKQMGNILYSSSDGNSSSEVKRLTATLEVSVCDFQLQDKLDKTVLNFSSVLKNSIEKGTMSLSTLQSLTFVLAGLLSVKEVYVGKYAALERATADLVKATHATVGAEYTLLEEQLEDCEGQIKAACAEVKSLLRVATKSDRYAVEQGLSEAALEGFWDPFIRVLGVVEL